MPPLSKTGAQFGSGKEWTRNKRGKTEGPQTTRSPPKPEPSRATFPKESKEGFVKVKLNPPAESTAGSERNQGKSGGPPGWPSPMRQKLGPWNNPHAWGCRQIAGPFLATRKHKAALGSRPVDEFPGVCEEKQKRKKNR